MVNYHLRDNVKRSFTVAISCGDVMSAVSILQDGLEQVCGLD